ncbi:MAG: hypothetical protein R3E01_07230 [Pirellulaceae bacterium]|nr:hypothetical protein [Planctomycetales bacterium]MCA9265488.1 hypothetical protein [Planctomycetales bacterium]
MNAVPRPGARIHSAAHRIAPAANALMLAACIAWTLCANAARTGIAELESLASSALPSDAAQAGTGRLLAVLFVVAVVGTFLLILIGLGIGRRQSRSIRAWLVLIFLIAGWIAAWLGRHDLYWYGHAIRVSTEVTAAADLAEALETNWPSRDGDYPQLSVVLGYPKLAPVTLILAGEPVRVGRLRIVAVEKSKDGRALRLQLANPNHDTWLVRSESGKDLAEFVNGFDSRYAAERTRRLSCNWYLIRYEAQHAQAENNPSSSKLGACLQTPLINGKVT